MLIALFMVGCAAEETDWSGGDATNGGEVFAANCASCHGDDALGGSGPALDEPIANDEASELADYILNGVGEMPAQDVTEDEVRDIFAYLHSLFD